MIKRLPCFLGAAGALLALQAVPAAQLPSTRDLMPVPARITWTTGRVPITAATTVAATGFSDARLRAAIDRAIVRLQDRTGLVLSREAGSDAAAATIVIACKGPGLAMPALGEDETYSIDAGRQVTLSANTVVGAMRGLETLLQLVSGDHDGFFVPGVSIQDQPRFPWRGLLIDVGRHFEPVGVIERELDAMAAVKLNVLHWHLSEDQGFRVESRRYPKLHELGSDGQYYTQAQLREVVEYAWMRGIRVVPEFDMPGHVMSWVVGYPELASAPGPFSIARKSGVFDAVFDPTRKDTYRFIDRFIGEIAPIFPDAYWHVGGDENNGKEWQANPKIQAFMQKNGLKDTAALQTYFSQQLIGILRKHGKRMMGWDEILQPGLPTTAVIQSWRGPKALVDAAKQGYDAVLSAGYYIDLMNSAASHYAVDPLPASAGLTPDQAAHVLGGEATMWGEWVDPETIDSRIWPRTAAIAERLWSPREVTDVDDMYRRLDAVSIELEDVGITGLRNRDVLLRRLANRQDVGLLQQFADLLEPVKGYLRGRQQPQMTTRGPLTHLVDAVGADSPGARRIDRLVGTLLADAPRFTAGREELTREFEGWQDNQPALTALVDAAPALHEVRPMVEGLAQMSTIGLDALTALSRGIVPDATWRDATLAALTRAAQPAGAVEFPFALSLRALVVAAADQRQLQTMTPAAWLEQVRMAAAPPRRGGVGQ
jgi:hexosaminidase